MEQGTTMLDGCVAMKIVMKQSLEGNLIKQKLWIVCRWTTSGEVYYNKDCIKFANEFKYLNQHWMLKKLQYFPISFYQVYSSLSLVPDRTFW